MTPITRTIALDALDVRARNPNRMSATRFALLVTSIRRHGFLQPMLVREQAGGRFEIVDGAHRYKAAREAGLDAVPCVVLGDDDNADDVAAALQIGMNRLRGDPDLAEVAEIVAELARSGWETKALTTTGFDEHEIDELIAAATGDDTRSLLAGSDTTLPEEDDKPEAPEVFAVTVELPSREVLARVKRALRKAGNGDMGRGLLALTGET